MSNKTGLIFKKHEQILFINILYTKQSFPKQALVFTYLPYNAFENTVGKGEIACKILDTNILKSFADGTLNKAQIVKFVSERKENIEGKGENAGYQHFLLFTQCFQMLSFSGLL